ATSTSDRTGLCIASAISFPCVPPVSHWAFNPPDPNHGPTPRSRRDTGYRVGGRWSFETTAVLEMVQG
ncbi:MAG: hypothetical protein ACKJSG_16890, partial [Lentisphaeria bacterium]